MIEIIKASISNQNAEIEVFDNIYSNNKEQYLVHFVFIDDSWDNYNKIVVFDRVKNYDTPIGIDITSKNSRLVEIINDREFYCVLPWEVITQAGYFNISINGSYTNENEELIKKNFILPTKFTIQDGGDTTVYPRVPTPNMYEQLGGYYQSLKIEVEEANKNAAAASQKVNEYDEKIEDIEKEIQVVKKVAEDANKNATVVSQKVNEYDEKIEDIEKTLDDSIEEINIELAATTKYVDDKIKKVDDKLELYSTTEYVDENIQAAKNEITSKSVGQAIPNGGEIFNDYENNIAEGSNSSSKGTQTAAIGTNASVEGEGFIGSKFEYEYNGIPISIPISANVDSIDGNIITASTGFLTGLVDINIPNIIHTGFVLKIGDNYIPVKSFTYKKKLLNYIITVVCKDDVSSIVEVGQKITDGLLGVAFGDNSHAGGRYSLALGDNSFSHGNMVCASEENTVSFGEKTIAERKNSATFGERTCAAEKNQLAIGEYNDYTTIIDGKTINLVENSDITNTNLEQFMYLPAQYSEGNYHSGFITSGPTGKITIEEIDDAAEGKPSNGKALKVTPRGDTAWGNRGAFGSTTGLFKEYGEGKYVFSVWVKVPDATETVQLAFGVDESADERVFHRRKKFFILPDTWTKLEVEQDFTERMRYLGIYEVGDTRELDIYVDNFIVRKFIQKKVTDDALLVVGNGTGEEYRSNAFVVYRDGSAEFTGDNLKVGGRDITAYISNHQRRLTEVEVENDYLTDQVNSLQKKVDELDGNYLQFEEVTYSGYMSGISYEDTLVGTVPNNVRSKAILTSYKNSGYAEIAFFQYYFAGLKTIRVGGKLIEFPKIDGGQHVYDKFDFVNGLIRRTHSAGYCADGHGFLNLLGGIEQISDDRDGKARYRFKEPLANFGEMEYLELSDNNYAAPSVYVLENENVDEEGYLSFNLMYNENYDAIDLNALKDAYFFMCYKYKTPEVLPLPEMDIELSVASGDDIIFINSLGVETTASGPVFSGVEEATVTITYLK